MDVNSIMKPTAAQKATAYLEYQYAEVKDLTTKFLTVVAAVLAFSVTFSEKIVDFAHAGNLAKWTMIFIWGFCLAAFVLGGCAIWLIYNAGIIAKDVELHNEPSNYRWHTRWAYNCLNVAGVLFVAGLGLLVIAGLIRVWPHA